MTGLAPKCARADCTRKPSRYLELLVPPKGFGMDRALRVTIGLALCKDHAHETTVDEMMGTGMAEPIVELPRMLGLQQPDLARAELRVRHLGDDNWQSFQASNASSQGRGRA